MSAGSWTVVVIDDHALLAEALVIALRGQELNAHAVSPSHDGDRQSLERAVLDLDPKMVVLDLDLGAAGDGMALVTGLNKRGIDVVVLTGSVDRTRHGEALAQGAAAVLSKSAPFADIVAAIRLVSEGRPVMPPEEQKTLIADWRKVAATRRDLRRRFGLITRREAEVLGLLMDGRHVNEIARLRFVSESTVRTQVKSILAKLEVSSQLTAVGLAHQLGWRPPQADAKDAIGA
jgi:DNA-binding NarL/FixJ family response regulator